MNPPRRTCKICGRVGSRKFRNDVCSNETACVERLCQRLFDEKKHSWTHTPGEMVFLGTIAENVKVYGVDRGESILTAQAVRSMTATLELTDVNVPVLQAILGPEAKI